MTTSAPTLARFRALSRKGRRAPPGGGAVELFVARARAVRFDFELTEADVESVAAIVRRVDRIPPAIELCAARMGRADPSNLSDRLQILRRGPVQRPLISLPVR